MPITRQREERPMKRMQQLKWWLMVVVAGVASVVQAEDVTVTTYYPSPRGTYQTLSTTSNTTLATDPLSSVGIGGVAALGAKLDVLGKLSLRDGTQGANYILQTDGTGLASWVPP